MTLFFLLNLNNKKISADRYSINNNKETSTIEISYNQLI